MFKLKIILFFLIIVTGFVSAQSNTQNFLVGADISAFQNIEKNNGKYFENGVEKSLLDILKENGFNTVRLRLWHTPSDGSNNLHNTLLMAKRIKEKGFKFLLDFHYSDTWADPGHQTKPLAWKDLSYEVLKDSIFSYSKNVLEQLSAQNTVPEFIQIGNEISCGFLWNTGSICGEFNTPEQWNKFAELLNSAIAGVKAGLTNPEAAKIIIHSDKGADNNSCKWFYTNLLNNNVEFDIIGLSYYPWWSGSLENLEFNLNDLAERFEKEIILLETAYPWTLDYYDNTHNPVGNQSQLLSEFPASVEGQTNYLLKVSEIVSSVKNSKGKGVFYWAPEWIPAENYGSSWENLTLFDFDGNTLSSINALSKNITNIQNNSLPLTFELKQNYPNPFNPVSTIEYKLEKSSQIKLILYSAAGEKIKTFIDEFQNAGSYSIKINCEDLTSGVYFYTLQSDQRSLTKKLVIIK